LPVSAPPKPRTKILAAIPIRAQTPDPLTTTTLATPVTPVMLVTLATLPLVTLLQAATPLLLPPTAW
jgi:hypothetical protein